MTLQWTEVILHYLPSALAGRDLSEDAKPPSHYGGPLPPDVSLDNHWNVPKISSVEI